MKCLAKKASLLVAVLLLVNLLAACGGGGGASVAKQAEVVSKTASQQSTQANSKPETGKGTLKLAVLVPGSINDGAFSALGYNSIVSFSEELKAQGYEVSVSYTEAKSPQDAEEGLDNYGAEGYDLIYAHDFAMGDTVERIAPMYPDSLFVISSGKWAGDNYSSFISQTTEIGYQQGAMAATLTSTKKIGFIGGDKMPAITRFIIAAEQGVTDTDASVEVKETYLGAQNDLGKAREATSSLINAGCDIIITSASAATQGVMQAAQEAYDAGKKIYVFTNTSNQSKDYPHIFVSTATVDTLAELRMAWDYWVTNDNKLSGQPFIAGTAEGCTIQIWNEELKAKLPAEVLQARDKAEAGIWDGSIVIDVPDY